MSFFFLLFFNFGYETIRTKYSGKIPLRDKLNRRFSPAFLFLEFCLTLKNTLDKHKNNMCMNNKPIDPLTTTLTSCVTVPNSLEAVHRYNPASSFISFGNNKTALPAAGPPTTDVSLSLTRSHVTLAGGLATDLQ